MSRVKPGIPDAVVTTSPEVHVVNGRPTWGLEVNVSPETFEEFRQGYRCVVCLAAQEHAFPEHCIEPYCRFPIKTKQLERLEFEYQGDQNPWETRAGNEANPTHPDIWTPGSA